MTYKVIDSHQTNKTVDGLPKHLLGDSIEEAEDVYGSFSGLLNSIAYTYHASTGVDKSDLFAEGVFALAKAKQDFDSNRSDDFTVYAIFIIKDALNEHIRTNARSVVIPSYLRKSSYVFDKLRVLLETTGVNMEQMFNILDTGKVEGKLPSDVNTKCKKLLEILNAYADRASISYNELITRIQLLPTEVSITSVSEPYKVESTEKSILVKQMMDSMDEDEKFICRCIMEDMSYADIAKKVGKSKSWVGEKIRTLKERFKDELP